MPSFTTYQVSINWPYAFLLLSLPLLTKAQPSLPYSINWINQVGVTTNNGILTKTAPTGSWGNAGAISSNLLPANANGWVEFTVVTGTNYRVGLAANHLLGSEQFSNGIFINDNTGSAIAFEAGTSTSLGIFQNGDVFRISRDESWVKYYKNGIALRTVAANALLELKVKACLYVNGATTLHIATSFDCRVIVLGNVQGIEGSGTGSISLNVSGGTSPYSYYWSSGEQTATINGKLPGIYTVTVTDALGRSENRTYNIGYNVDWIDKTGVSANSGILTKTAASGTWSNAGAISSNILPSNTNGWIEFTTVAAASFRIGLATNNLLGYGQFANSIFIDSNTGNGIAFEGETSASLSNFQHGDVFRISRESDSVKYYRNGIVLRKIKVSPLLELKVKACIYNTGASTPNITSSFDYRLVVLGSVLGLEGNSGAGSISLNVTGGVPPYTYSWSNGEHTSSIINKPRGTYTIRVTDALGKFQDHTYSIGYKVNWINQVGVNTNGPILTKTSQDQNWVQWGY